MWVQEGSHETIFFPHRKVSFLPSATSLCLVLGGMGVGAAVGKGNSGQRNEGHHLGKGVKMEKVFQVQDKLSEGSPLNQIIFPFTSAESQSKMADDIAEA
ncbi:hypothetical protein JZ751_014896 [Albula glossodonta]|uniref:Uncharacterized protein n=1 Tax=Albula glossodonta TaxID=121402 RepID=A0A8T2N8G8_9TELE|nr:hypothetical protein JZ751_014896 [Albula glossodonta]